MKKIELIISNALVMFIEYIDKLIRSNQRRREEVKLETLLLQRLKDENTKELNISGVKAKVVKDSIEMKSKN